MRNKSNEDSILPSTKSVPFADLIQYTWLIYGRIKIGKTTLLSMFPKCLHFMWEPGASALKIFKVPKNRPSLRDWKEGLKVIKRLEERNDDPNYQYKTVCFDTGSVAFKRCLKFMMDTELDGVHPNKAKDYGASWDLVGQEFQALHSRIAQLGLGFVVVAHETEKEIEDDVGRTYDRIQPKFGKNVADFYEQLIDNIGYYHFVGKERFLQIRGDKTVVAGTRCDGHFLTPEGADIWEEISDISCNRVNNKKNRLKIKELSREMRDHQIIKIPMGYTPQNAYSNLVAAFNNKQRRTLDDDDYILKKGGKIHEII